MCTLGFLFLLFLFNNLCIFLFDFLIFIHFFVLIVFIPHCPCTRQRLRRWPRCWRSWRRLNFGWWNSRPSWNARRLSSGLCSNSAHPPNLPFTDPHPTAHTPTHQTHICITPDRPTRTSFPARSSHQAADDLTPPHPLGGRQMRHHTDPSYYSLPAFTSTSTCGFTNLGVGLPEHSAPRWGIPHRWHSVILLRQLCRNTLGSSPAPRRTAQNRSAPVRRLCTRVADGMVAQRPGRVHRPVRRTDVGGAAAAPGAGGGPGRPRCA